MKCKEVTSETQAKTKPKRKVYRQHIFKTPKQTLALSYKIPSSIYEKYKNDLSADLAVKKKAHLTVSRSKCHQTNYENFNTGETPNCISNLLVAARQSFECRDFKTLIEILEKSLKIRDVVAKQQVLAYMEGYM